MHLPSSFIALTTRAIFGGILANKFTVYRARRNHGISEPEDKLWLFVLPGVFCPIGLLMTGLGPYYGAHWAIYVIGETLTGLGGPLATMLVLAYAFDAFHTIDPEDPSPVKVAAQDNAPYIIAIVFIGMCVTFAMVSCFFVAVASLTAGLRHHALVVWMVVFVFWYHGVDIVCGRQPICSGYDLVR